MRYPITATEGSNGMIPRENLNYSIKNTRIVVYKDGRKILDKEFIKEPDKNYCISTDNDTIDVIPDDVEECNVGTMLPQGMGVAHTKNITAAGVAKEDDLGQIPTALVPSYPDIMNLENATKEDLVKLIYDLKYEKANGLISKEELEEKYNLIKECAGKLLSSKYTNVTESAETTSEIKETSDDIIESLKIAKMFAYIEGLLNTYDFDEEVIREYEFDPNLIGNIRDRVKYEKMLKDNNNSDSSNDITKTIIKESLVSNEIEKRTLIKNASDDAKTFIEAFDIALHIKESDLDDDEKESELDKLREEYYRYGRDNETPENRKYKEHLRQKIKALEEKERMPVNV